jgi:hypothetical protein
MMIKLKRNDKIGLVFFLAFIISMSLVWLFEERFDQEQWRSNPGKRYKMAKNIIEQDLLDNKSKEEVIQILGEPVTAEFSDNNILIYQLGTPPSFFDEEPQELIIVLKDSKVIHVSVNQEE